MVGEADKGVKTPYFQKLEDWVENKQLFTKLMVRTESYEDKQFLPTELSIWQEKKVSSSHIANFAKAKTAPLLYIMHNQLLKMVLRKIYSSSIAFLTKCIP